MSLRSAASAAIRPYTLATLTAVAAMAFAAAAAGAPAARAADPLPLPAQLTAAIAHDDLPVQTSHGWEAVTGDAADVNAIRTLAHGLGIGTYALYADDNETGHALLIFTGNDDAGATAFQVTGATAYSVDNDTDQTWYIYNGSGKPDAAIGPGTATDIPPADAAVANFSVTLFSFSPSLTEFSF
jgi:hypothetical protein